MIRKISIFKYCTTPKCKNKAVVSISAKKFGQRRVCLCEECMKELHHSLDLRIRRLENGNNGKVSKVRKESGLHC